MQEVFEKIKERLKTELKCTRDKQSIECMKNDGFGTPLQAKYSGNIEMLIKAIEIVNQVAEEVLEKEFSEWCHDCKEYDKEKHHCPRWCKVIQTTVEEIKGNLDVPEINVGDIGQVCEWMQDDGATDIYDTKCGNTHMFIDGNPTDNKYEFCPYCGKKIEVVE